MWPFGVVLLEPVMRQLSYFVECLEDVGIEQFITIGAVEPFDVGVL